MAGLENVPENRLRDDSHRDQHPNVPPPREIGWAERHQLLLVALAGIVVCAILRATINPPGGLWKRNGVLPDNTEYEVGKSKLAYIWPEAYVWLVGLTAGTLYGSCTVVTLLVFRMHVLMRKLFTCIAVVWIALSFITLTYNAALRVLIYYQDVGDVEDERVSAVLSMIPFLGLVIFLCSKIRMKEDHGNDDGQAHHQCLKSKVL